MGVAELTSTFGRPAVSGLMDLLDALLSSLAWLVYPVVIPVPALLILGPTAWGTVRWSRRRREQTLPPPLFTQPWAWIGWAAVGLFAFITIGVAVFAWQPALILAAWLVVPLGVILSALLRARHPRRTLTHGET